MQEMVEGTFFGEVMNQSDKKIISRLNDVMAIPMPTHCVKQASVMGLSEYAADMRYAMPKIRIILTALCQGEAWGGYIEEELEELESWYSGCGDRWNH